MKKETAWTAQELATVCAQLFQALPIPFTEEQSGQHNKQGWSVQSEQRLLPVCITAQCAAFLHAALVIKRTLGKKLMYVALCTDLANTRNNLCHTSSCPPHPSRSFQMIFATPRHGDDGKMSCKESREVSVTVSPRGSI
eukprot:1157739-Pelagomonas_calceolata.AAC.7